MAALAQTGDAAALAANSGAVAPSATFSHDEVTRVEGAVLDASGNLSPHSATELTASTPLPNHAATSATKAAGAPGRLGLLLAGGAITLAAGLALWFGRSPSFTPQGVSSSAASAPPWGSGSSLSVTQTKPAASDSAASSVVKASGFAGLPARDVPAGLVPASNAWLDRFSVLRREDNVGLNYSQAFARCTDAGKTLCSESQWQRACDSFPEVGAAPSWTESLSEGLVVVRGGGSCTPRKLAAESERDAERVGLCCDRAVAMTSTSLQKPFLSSTAGIVLRLERTLNQRSIDGFLDLAEDHVLLNEHARDKPSLKALLTQSFAGAHDLVIVNDTCDVSVAARKVVKRSRRVKRTSYETTGWTAVCQQTRHRDGKAVSAKSSYEFSATSKLRAISDSEAPATTE